MPHQARTFRVFVSSTFNDLKSERNALQERVFPRLRELAAKHSYQFQAVDLRWGVSDEASYDQQAMNICLDEIQRCQQVSPRPNFIVLLGDRYGWMPPPSNIPAKEFKTISDSLDPETGGKSLLEWVEDGNEPDEDADMVYWDPDIEEYRGKKGWYRLDNNAVPPEYVLLPRVGKWKSNAEWAKVEGRLQQVLEDAAMDLGTPPENLIKYTTSATEQEIQEGALKVKDADEHVFCFFRSITGLPVEYSTQKFLQDVDERLSEVYGSELPDPAFESYIRGIKDVEPSSNAKEMDKKLAAMLEETPENTPASDFLNLLRGWLVDFTGRDFLNFNEADWSPDQDSLNNQTQLKEKLEFRVPSKTYTAHWKGRGITTNHIDQLCEDVYESLSKIILHEIDAGRVAVEQEASISLIDAHEDLDEEGLAHRDFAEDRLQHFIGRTQILGTIEGYIKSDPSRVLGIFGDGGTGKSALTAKAIHETQRQFPEAHIVYRFVGATPGSSDGRSLLDSLCREISRRYTADESDIPLDYRDLVPEFGKRLGLAIASEPLIVFIDSLDQLISPQGVRDLTWLPDNLPDNVSVVVTTRPEDTYERLQTKQARLEQLGGLSRENGEKLLNAWLRDAGRELQDAQLEAVLDAFDPEEQGGAPLYLKLAFEEARLWVSGDGQPPEELAAGIKGIIKGNMIKRLADEGNHGQKLVSHVLGYLAASRYGLAEDEIIDLLSRDMDVYRWFLDGSYHVPADLVRSALEYQEQHEYQGGVDRQKYASDQERAVAAWLKEIRDPPEELDDFLQEVLPKPEGPRLPIVLWSRLSFDLEPYLSERTSEGSTLLAFYHRELGDVSEEEFLKEEDAIPFHEKLANYFQYRADPGGDKNWKGSYPRGLSELPYHLTQAEEWDQVYETLTDFRFLEEKAAQVGVAESEDDEGQVVKIYTGVFQLQEDYERALGAMPGEGGARTGAGEYPLIITAVDRGEGLTIYCPVCNITSPIEESQLDKVIYCPTEGCGRGLKINSFYTDMAKGG